LIRRPPPCSENKFRDRIATRFSRTITSAASAQTASPPDGNIFSAWQQRHPQGHLSKRGSTSGCNTRGRRMDALVPRADYKIIYAPESVAMHRTLTPEQACKRSFGEARALAAVWPARGRILFRAHSPLGWLNGRAGDFFFAARKNRLGEWPHALRIRWRQRRAPAGGFADGWKITAKTEPSNTSILLVPGQNPAV